MHSHPYPQKSLLFASEQCKTNILEHLRTDTLFRKGGLSPVITPEGSGGGGGGKAKESQQGKLRKNRKWRKVKGGREEDKENQQCEDLWINCIQYMEEQVDYIPKKLIQSNIDQQKYNLLSSYIQKKTKPLPKPPNPTTIPTINSQPTPTTQSKTKSLHTCQHCPTQKLKKYLQPTHQQRTAKWNRIKGLWGGLPYRSFGDSVRVLDSCCVGVGDRGVRGKLFKSVCYGWLVGGNWGRVDGGRLGCNMPGKLDRCGQASGQSNQFIPKFLLSSIKTQQTKTIS